MTTWNDIILKNTKEESYMGNEVTAALLGGILAGGFAIWFTQRSLKDSLDSKSE